MWCWRRIEKISWTDHVRNEEVLLRVKEQRNILHEISKRRANWIGHILRRNCLLQQVIEGRIKGGIEVAGRWRRRRTNLLDDLKERRGYSHLKEEVLDHTMWRARFGRGFGPVVRQTNKWMNSNSYMFWHRRACIIFSAFVGWCINCKNIHSMCHVRTTKPHTQHTIPQTVCCIFSYHTEICESTCNHINY